jgi:hypothetical protein
MANSAIRDMVHDTENEIFAFATDSPDPETMFGDEDIDDLDMAEVEGWDGLPLGPEELAHTNMYGFDPDGNDRPVAMAEEADRHDQILKSNQELIDAMGAVQAERDKQQWEREKQDLALQVVGNPERTIDYAIAQEQRANELSANLVNMSMGRAHEQHGEDFDRAYKELISMSEKDPAACQIVQSIWNHPDPGGALMNWHASGGAGALRGARPGMMPSLNSQTPAPRSFSNEDRSGWAENTSAWGDDSEESGIFRDVWR